MLLGVVAGVFASVAVAGLFYAGDRLFPTPEPRGASSTRSGRHKRGSGDERRHTEIRAYLTAIDEQFEENHPVSGVTVPFFLPDRGVAITFDAHDYFRLEEEGVFTVLCEHEMPGRGLGRRLPFGVDESALEDEDAGRAGSTDRRSRAGRAGRASRAGLGGGTRAAGRAKDRLGGARESPIGDAFETLGLPRDASPDAVKQAYRERVKEVHPDRGGNEETFKRVQKAYATASEHAETGSHAPSAAAQGRR
ncbi:J domain-containing protein [Halorubrum gandharaense]